MVLTLIIGSKQKWTPINIDPPRGDQQRNPRRNYRGGRDGGSWRQDDSVRASSVDARDTDTHASRGRSSAQNRAREVGRNKSNEMRDDSRDRPEHRAERRGPVDRR